MSPHHSWLGLDSEGFVFGQTSEAEEHYLGSPEMGTEPVSGGSTALQRPSGHSRKRQVRETSPEDDDDDDEDDGEVAPTTPKPRSAKRRRPSPAIPTKPTRGTQRSLPYEGCVRAAIAGKGDGGLCYDCATGRSKRCFACASGGHPCRALPSVMVPIARQMLRSLGNDTKMYDRCRSALRLQLDLLADEKSVYSEEDRSAAATGAKAEEVRGWQSRVRAATKQLGKVLSGAPFAKE